VAVLGAKAPDELEAYRRFVLDVAAAAAEAKGGVRDEETAAIEKIKGALGAA
jgi:tellurite resistance protein